MLRSSSVLLFLLHLLVVCPGFIFCCGGFELLTKKLQNCQGSDSNLKLTNLNVTLTNDCKVETSGCIENKKAFTTSKVYYKLSKGVLYNKEGHDDLCKQLPKASNDIKLILSFLNIEHACPMRQKKICGGPENKVDVKKFERSLGVLEGGLLKASLMLTTEAGLSCIEFEGLVRRKNLLFNKS